VIIHVARRLHIHDLVGHVLEHTPGMPNPLPQGLKISRPKRKKP
jgi:hypothetical protein